MKKLGTSKKISGGKAGPEMPAKGPGKSGMRKAGIAPSMSVGTKKGKPC